MLNIYARTCGGQEILLGDVLSFTLDKAYDVPADSFEAVFPCEYPLPELSQVRVEYRGGVLFYGIVDEQSSKVTSQGCTAEISARSFAALLLDNEAVPAVYNRPSLHDIIKIHAAGYGFTCSVPNVRCEGDFVVSKGMSEWEVIQTFCESVLGIIPQVDACKDIKTLDKPNDGDRAVISNTAQRGYPFISAKCKSKRYGTVSQVLYKPDNQSGYVYSTINGAAASGGIQCRRLINLAGSPSWMNRYKIQSIIDDSVKESFETEVWLLPERLFEVGDIVDFSDERLGSFNGLRVFEVKYSSGADGIICKLLLRRKL